MPSRRMDGKAVWLQSFVALAVDAAELSVTRLGHFIPEKERQNPANREVWFESVDSVHLAQ